MLENIEMLSWSQQKEEQTIKPNYHTSKFFTIGLLATEMKKKTEILINKPVHLGFL